MSKLKRRPHHLRDFTLYILIAMAIAGFAILLGVLSGKTGQRPEIVAKWVGLAGLLLCGAVFLVMRWRLRKMLLFLERLLRKRCGYSVV